MNWICKTETIDIENLSIEDKMQVIFNQFNTNVEVLSCRFDKFIFSPVFKIRYSGKVQEIKVTITLIEDITQTLKHYDSKYLIFMDKEALNKGILKLSTKLIK